MSDEMDDHKISGSPYGYSATRLTQLLATEYTLVGIAADVSGSTHPFRVEVERCIEEIVRACQQAPRADNVMLRLSSFDDSIHENHGFKPIPVCDPGSYGGVLNGGGATALYDAAHNGVRAILDYGDRLVTHGFAVNGLLFVLTDGLDNSSLASAAEVQQAVKDALFHEQIRGLQTILVGVNATACSAALMQVSTQVGFDAYLDIGDADADALARLARFATKSIAVSSTALGQGTSIDLSSLTF